MTRTSRPTPREVAARPADSFLPVAVLVIAVGIGLRSAGIAFSLWGDPQLAIFRQCLVGLGLQLAAIALVRRGHFAWAVFLAGFDFLVIAQLALSFGTSSDFHLYGMVPSLLVLTFTGWSVRVRVLLALGPPAGLATLQNMTNVPLSTGLLPPGSLESLAAMNVVVFVALCLAVTLRSVQLAERARQRAQGLAEARSRLIDDMSHELRTPVTIVITAAQAALMNERSEESYRGTLRVIERQARSLGRLMGRMLEMGRAEHGEAEISASDDLVDSVRRIMDGFRELAKERSISLVLDAGPVAAATDSAVLQVVLGNLLSNAIRFSPDGGRVEVRVTADGSGRRITVRDEGPGIAPQDLPHIFERYWRADRARSRRDGHYGLGLAIARRYAGLLGATIDCDSRPGRGSSFTVRWLGQL